MGIGEAIGIGIVAAPAMLVGRWTAQRRHLRWRVGLQLWMATLVLIGVPIAVAPRRFVDGVAAMPPGSRWLGLQVTALGVVIAVAAVWEFLERGQGSPWPWDPPRRLVATGPYRFVRNPMQLGALVASGGLFMLSGSPWTLAAMVIGVPFGAALARTHEDAVVAARVGPAWHEFVGSRRCWLPRWRARPVPLVGPPGVSADTARNGTHQRRAVLWIARGCDVCSPVGEWFMARHAVDLIVRPAEDHATGVLRRAAYEGEDGYRADGVAAVAHALEHLTLDWALVGFVLRLPGIRSVATSFADAVGFGQRDLAVTCRHDPTKDRSCPTPHSG